MDLEALRARAKAATQEHEQKTAEEESNRREEQVNDELKTHQDKRAELAAQYDARMADLTAREKNLKERKAQRESDLGQMEAIRSELGLNEAKASEAAGFAQEVEGMNMDSEERDAILLEIEEGKKKLEEERISLQQNLEKLNESDEKLEVDSESIAAEKVSARTGSHSPDLAVQQTEQLSPEAMDKLRDEAIEDYNARENERVTEQKEALQSQIDEAEKKFEKNQRIADAATLAKNLRDAKANLESSTRNKSARQQEDQSNVDHWTRAIEDYADLNVLGRLDYYADNAGQSGKFERDRMQAYNELRILERQADTIKPKEIKPEENR